MGFPALLKRLFQNDGAGPLLKEEIIPTVIEGGTITLDGDTTGTGTFDKNATMTVTTTTENSTKWNSAAKTVTTSSASGGSDGDIHFQYIS